jgi:hypothetical protein
MFDSISWAADAIISETDITLSFRDRLKLLLGASLALRTVVATENLVGGPPAPGRQTPNKVGPGRWVRPTPPEQAMPIPR